MSSRSLASRAFGDNPATVHRLLIRRGMKTVLAYSLATALLSTTLIGCATDAVEEDPLGDEMSDGAADSWSRPTKFGELFEDTWLFGNLDPGSNIRYAT